MPVSSIDTTGGGDYTTVTLWEADTDNDLVTAADGEVGEVVDGQTVTEGATVSISGATTNASFFRELRSAGLPWDTDAGSGTTLRFTGENDLLSSNEEFVRVFDLRVFRDTTTASTGSNRHIVSLTAFGHHIGYVTIERTTASSANGTGRCISVVGGATAVSHVYNCTVFGNGLTTGMGDGIIVQADTNVFNCDAYNLTGTGIFSNSGGEVVEGCIAMDNGSQDLFDSGADFDFNLSSDATAVGANSHASETLADIWVDAANGDFTLVRDSNAHNGATSQTVFDDDIFGTTRPIGVEWDMGPRELLALAGGAPGLAALVIRLRSSRRRRM